MVRYSQFDTVGRSGKVVPWHTHERPVTVE